MWCRASPSRPTMKSVSYKVIAKSAGQRLDVFVAGELGVTRSYVQKLIEAESITVNGKLPKKAGDTVKEGDVVTFVRTSPRAPLLEARGRQQNNTKRVTLSQGRGIKGEGLALEPTVIAETKDYIVLNKPAGLLVHPTQAHEKNTLVSWLVKKYPAIKKVGDDPAVRPGIVHRLDKEASGLMVVARTQKMFNHLKEQFKNRTVQKEYFALAHGKVAKDWDDIRFPIARGENFDRMAARPMRRTNGVQNIEPLQPAVGAQYFVPPTEDGAKDAHTEFLVEKRFANCTLLRVILHTGRMHQIRVHMLAYNHPLVGDPLYYQKKRKKNLDEKCGRLFLHSVSLAFLDLEGDRRSFEAPLPDKLQTFLLTLH